MKKLITVLSLVLSVSAVAGEVVSFGYSGYEGWGRSYYSCDYVEAQTEKVLEMFGATEIDVNCSGGISYGQIWMPVSVRAEFTAPVVSETSTTTVTKYKGDTWNPSCGINVAIVKNLLPKFANVQVLKKSDSCAFQSSNFEYTFSITK